MFTNDTLRRQIAFIWLLESINRRLIPPVTQYKMVSHKDNLQDASYGRQGLGLSRKPSLPVITHKKPHHNRHGSDQCTLSLEMTPGILGAVEHWCRANLVVCLKSVLSGFCAYTEHFAVSMFFSHAPGSVCNLHTDMSSSRFAWILAYLFFFLCVCVVKIYFLQNATALWTPTMPV